MGDALLNFARVPILLISFSIGDKGTIIRGFHVFMNNLLNKQLSDKYQRLASYWVIYCTNQLSTDYLRDLCHLRVVAFHYILIKHVKI